MNGENEAKEEVLETAVEEPTAVEYAESKAAIKMKMIGVNAITLFCRQLSTLVDVGIPLLKCLQILYQRTAHPKLQSIIQRISQDIEQGAAFSVALEKFPKVFSPFFVNMTKVAEKGGSLDESLKIVADALEKEDLMKVRGIGTKTFERLRDLITVK